MLGGGVSEVSEDGGVSLLGFLKESGGPGSEGLVGAAIVEDVIRAKIKAVANFFIGVLQFLESC